MIHKDIPFFHALLKSALIRAQEREREKERQRDNGDRAPEIINPSGGCFTAGSLATTTSQREILAGLVTRTELKTVGLALLMLRIQFSEDGTQERSLQRFNDFKYNMRAV